MKNKYHARKVTVNGITYDSKKEARRHAQLLEMERNGEIVDLQRQVKFVLIPAQREPDSIGPRGGAKKGKLIERECAYVADFVYTVVPADNPSAVEQRKIRRQTPPEDAGPVSLTADSSLYTREPLRCVEDTKGVRTKDYIIKRKLMLWIHGIRIREV